MVKGKGKGWHGDSARHSRAARGRRKVIYSVTKRGSAFYTKKEAQQAVRNYPSLYAKKQPNGYYILVGKPGTGGKA